MKTNFLFIKLFLCFLPAAAMSKVITVGPNKQYATLKAAVSASAAGDTIEIQAGTYTNDFPAQLNKALIIKGVGGKARLVATQLVPNRKGIFVTSSNVTLSNLEITGATISNADGANGAAVRFEGGNLIIDNCFIHKNQNGIMGSASGSVTIKNSNFSSNGVSDSANYSAGYGYTHNLYIKADKLSIWKSYFFAANVGHNIKSRAATNEIIDSVIVDGSKGTTSYSIDLPNGGVAVIQDNLIEKGPRSGNSNFIAFGAEGSLMSPSSLKIEGNIFLNDKGSANMLYNHTTISAVIRDNDFFGLTSSQIAKGPSSISGSRTLTSSPYALADWSTTMPSPWPAPGDAPATNPGDEVPQTPQIPQTPQVPQVPAVVTSIFGASDVPRSASHNDTSAVEVGVKFKSSKSGFINGVRFYKGAQNTGSHVGNLWDSTGKLLASVKFVNESASGWQQALFAKPVAIAASTNYVVSYHAPKGRYAITSNYFAKAKTNGSLSALSGKNGVYRYGASGFPSLTYQQSNYWVDVVYSASSTTTPPPQPPTQPVTCSFNGKSIAVGGSVTAYQASSVAYGSSCVSQSRVCGANGVLSGSYTFASCTVQAAPPTNPPASNGSGIFSASDVPSVASDSDLSSVELGMKFKSSKAGTVRGVRFYKGAQNTGTHIGNIWDEVGNLLGSVTFANESASGWQQAIFEKPVGIRANETYIVSYFAPAGRYSATANYFSAEKVNGPLTALSGNNGVYRYGSSSGFPDLTYGSTNYFVDVIFDGSVITPPTQPTQPPQQVTCTFNGNSILVNGTITAYQSASVPTGSACVSQSRVCGANGVLSGSYIYPSCIVESAPATPGIGITSLEFINYQNVQQSNRIVTFGQGFAKGDLPANGGLALQINGTNYKVQIDNQVKHSDGSLQFAVLTAQVPTLAANQAVALGLVTTAGPIAGVALTPEQVLNRTDYDVEVSIVLNGNTYTASAKQALQAAVAANKVPKHLSGPLASEFNVRQNLTAHLGAEFDIRLLANGDIRTEVTITNTYGFVSGMKSQTYNVSISQAGQQVYVKNNLKHSPYANWHMAFVHGGATNIYVKGSRAYWAKSRLVPHYDPKAIPTNEELNQRAKTATSSNCGPMGTGTMATYMPTTGFREDMGFLPAWDAVYFMSMDKRALDLVLCNADAAASIPYHVSEVATGLPYSLDNHPTIWFDDRGASNANRLANTGYYSSIGDTPWSPDTAHMPSVGYSAYLITGNRVYLQETIFQMQGALGLMWNSPRQNGKGIAFSEGEGIRSQAFTFRSIANAAVIAPDTHPMKAYLTRILDNNLQWLLDSHVNGVFNTQQGEVHGYIMGQGRDGWFYPHHNGYAAVAIGQVANRGNAKAKIILDWMSNFIMGFFTPGNGFCSINNIYEINLNDSSGKPIKTWAALKQAHYGSGSCPTNLDIGDFSMPLLAAMGPMVDQGIPNAQKTLTYIIPYHPLWSPNVMPNIYSERKSSQAHWAISPMQP